MIKVDTQDYIQTGCSHYYYFILWFLLAGVVFAVVSYLLFESWCCRGGGRESEDRYRAVVEQAAEVYCLSTVMIRGSLKVMLHLKVCLVTKIVKLNMTLHDMIAEDIELQTLR